MKVRMIVGCSVFLCAACAMPASAAVDFAPVKAIVGRLAGGYSGAADAGADAAKANAAMARFEFVEDATLGDSATVGPSGDKIRIAAANPGAASFALGRYLRETARGHVSWCGNRAPSAWPLPAAEKTYTPGAPVRQAYNYCTLSYTMAFWGKAEWREEIDRLALNGFNAALVLQGLQKVWTLTLSEMGYTGDQIKAFIADEASQAWWHMGNLQGLGGPISDARVEADAELGRWLYAEMKKVGVEPILQSFVGLIPSASSAAALNAKYGGDTTKYALQAQGGWVCGYVRPTLVLPTTQAFADFSNVWYPALREVYATESAGNPKFMAGDLFHEGGNKGSLSDDDVRNAAISVQAMQQTYFPGAKWFLQSWQDEAVKTFIYQGVKPSLTLVQVLAQDQSTTGASTQSYRTLQEGGGFLPWIWAEVLNFGGNTGMYGGARRMRNLAVLGTDATQGAYFRGYGMLSEGLETNPAMYDLFTEGFAVPPGAGNALDDEGVAAYLSAYVQRRYGVSENAALNEAMQILLNTVWGVKQRQQGCVESVLCATPSYAVTSASAWGPKTGTPYDRTLLYDAARDYLDAMRDIPSLKDEDTFRYDVCELFLQLISDRAREINPQCETSQAARDEFRRLLDLADRLTACSPRWRLDWHEARTTETSGAADGYKGRQAYRRMVTSWTGNYDTAKGGNGLHDYAHRAYSGLLKAYYAKRWEWFFRKTEGTLEGNYEDKLRALDASILTNAIDCAAAGDLEAVAAEVLNSVDTSYKVGRDETKTPATADLIAGEVTISGGTLELAFPAGTSAAIAQLRVRPEVSTIRLATGSAESPSTLTIEKLAVAAGARLVLSGTAESLNAASTCRVAFPASAVGKVFYVCTDASSESCGQEQPLALGADGWAKVSFSVLDYETCVTGSPRATGWKNVTLDELERCVFTGQMGGNWVNSGTPVEARGYQMVRSGDALTVQMQASDRIDNVDGWKSVTLTFTVRDGEVFVSGGDARYTKTASVGSDAKGWSVGTFAAAADANGYAIVRITTQPAVARAEATRSNYGSFGEAWAVGGDVTVFGYGEYGTAQGLGGGRTVTVEKTGTLALTCRDAIDWNGKVTLNLYGTLDVGANGQSFELNSSTRNDVLNLFAGAKVLGAGDGEGALSFCGNARTVAVAAADGEDTVTIEGVLVCRTAVAFDVADGVKLVLKGDFGKSATAGNAAVCSLEKTGSGEMVLDGVAKSGREIPLVATAGKLTKNLAEGTSVAITEKGAAVEVVNMNPDDFKIVQTAAGDVTTYSSVRCVWLVAVTDPGVLTQESPNKKLFESLAEAVVYARELKASTSEPVLMWVYEANKDLLTMPEGYAQATSPAGIQITGWETAVVDPISPAVSTYEGTGIISAETVLFTGLTVDELRQFRAVTGKMTGGNWFADVGGSLPGVPVWKVENGETYLQFHANFNGAWLRYVTLKLTDGVDDDGTPVVRAVQTEQNYQAYSSESYGKSFLKGGLNASSPFYMSAIEARAVWKYYTGTATAWTKDIKVSATKDGDANLDVLSSDTIVFAQGGSFPGGNNIYIKDDVPAKRLVVKDRTLLHVGGGFAGGRSLTDGYVVEIEEDSALYICGWGYGSGESRTFGLSGTVTFKGAGEVRFGAHDAKHFVAGSIKGSAALVLEDGVDLTLSGSVLENTVRLEGAQAKLVVPESVAATVVSGDSSLRVTMQTAGGKTTYSLTEPRKGLVLIFR